MNSLEGIPEELKSRMDIIPIDPYSLDQKGLVQTRFIIPKAHETAGLKPGAVHMGVNELRELNTRYHQEGGVRESSKSILKLVEAAGLVIDSQREPSAFRVTSGFMHNVLGAPPIGAIEPITKRELPLGEAWGVEVGENSVGDAVASNQVTFEYVRPGIMVPSHETTGLQRKDTRETSWTAANAIEFLWDDIYHFFHPEYDRFDSGQREVSWQEREDFVHVRRNHHKPPWTDTGGPSGGVVDFITEAFLWQYRLIRSDMVLTGAIQKNSGLIDRIGGVLQKLRIMRVYGARHGVFPRGNYLDVIDALHDAIYDAQLARRTPLKILPENYLEIPWDEADRLDLVSESSPDRPVFTVHFARNLIDLLPLVALPLPKGQVPGPRPFVPREWKDVKNS